MRHLPLLLVLTLTCFACDDGGGSGNPDTDSTSDVSGDMPGDTSTDSPSDAGDADLADGDASDSDVQLPSCDDLGPTSIARLSNGTAYATDSCGRLFSWGPRHPTWDMATEQSIRPSPEEIGERGWLEVAAGESHACGVRIDGSLWCWGSGPMGELGLGMDPSAFNQPDPTRVGVEDDWSSVASTPPTQSGTTCGVRGTGELWCWGSNRSGLLTSVDDTLPDVLYQPTRVGTDSDWAQLAFYFNIGCGVKTTGELWCWGSNELGHLGNGTLDNNMIHPPEQVAGEWRWVGLDQQGVCGIRTDDTLWCWGNMMWLDSIVTTENRPHPAPIQIGPGLTFEAVDYNLWHLAAALTDGRFAELEGDPIQETSALAIDDARGTGWVDVSLFGGPRDGISGTVCAAKDVGEVWCRGANATAELGIGTWATRWAPTQVSPDTNYRDVAMGGLGGACAIRGTDVVCWGQVGAFTPDRVHAHQIPESIAAPEQMAVLEMTDVGELCAIADSGALYCIGAVNAFGQLGVSGGMFVAGQWHQVGSSTQWVDVALSAFDACGVNGGQLSCWGASYPGDPSTLLDPVNSDWTEADVAPFQNQDVAACGLRTGGSMWCVDPAGTLTRIGTGTGYQGLRMRQEGMDIVVCALDASGALQCAPPDGTAEPSAVGNDVWLALERSANVTCGVRSNGTFTCDAPSGPLQGRGDPVGSDATIDDTDWFDLVHSNPAVCGLKGKPTGGELWCWGDGLAGRTGNGEALYNNWVRVPGIGP